MTATLAVDASLLRNFDCGHEPGCRQIVSDRVVYEDKAPDFGPGYAVSRQVIVCTACGLPVEVRDVERASTGEKR